MQLCAQVVNLTMPGGAMVAYANELGERVGRPAGAGNVC